MVLIITGLVFVLFGWGNLVVSRLHPERPNAGFTKKLGYVGIAVGVITLIAAIAMLLLPAPNLPAPS